MAALTQSQWPIGTLDELRKAGLSSLEHGSCAPSHGMKQFENYRPGVRGCPVYDKCPFNRRSMGAFKDQGPRYVGYSLKTHEGDVKEDTTTCYRFVQTLYERMRAGERDRQDGNPHGELIQIIAHEGDGSKVMTKESVRVDPDDRSQFPLWHNVYTPKLVPRHPRPGQSIDENYAHLVNKRMAERMKADPDFVDQQPHEPITADPDPPFDLDMAKQQMTAQETELAAAKATSDDPGLAVPVGKVKRDA